MWPSFKPGFLLGRNRKRRVPSDDVAHRNSGGYDNENLSISAAPFVQTPGPSTHYYPDQASFTGGQADPSSVGSVWPIDGTNLPDADSMDYNYDMLRDVAFDHTFDHSDSFTLLSLSGTPYAITVTAYALPDALPALQQSGGASDPMNGYSMTDSWSSLNRRADSNITIDPQALLSPAPSSVAHSQQSLSRRDTVTTDSSFPSCPHALEEWPGPSDMPMQHKSRPSTVHLPAQSHDSSSLGAPSTTESTASAACYFEGCDAVFTGPYCRGSRSRHIRDKHRGQRARQYWCEHCDHKAFMRQDARLRHCRNKHPELQLPAAIPRHNRRNDVTEAQTELLWNVDPRLRDQY